jgi:hypothetical protein
VAVDGRNPGQAKHCQGRKDEDGSAEHSPADDGQVRARRADRIAQCLDPDPRVAPVADGVERPVEGREETEVEDLHDHNETKNRSNDPGEEASTGGGQGESQRDHDEALDRDSHERAGRETTRLVGSDEGGPRKQDGEDREHCGDPSSHTPDGRHSAVRGLPVAPQPQPVAAERLGKQRKRSGNGGLGQSQRQDVCSRDRQDNPLSHSNDLAPVARR